MVSSTWAAVFFGLASGSATDMKVGKVCVTNSAGFVLHWEARDLITDVVGPDSGTYPIDQTRCMDLSNIAKIEDGHAVMTKIHADAGESQDVDKAVLYGNDSEYVATYYCTGATLTYSCKLAGVALQVLPPYEVQTDLQVSKVCVTNSAGFVLHWEARDLLSDTKGPDSGRYPIDQTRCMGLDGIANIEDGHPVMAQIHAVAGVSHDVDKAVMYSSTSEYSATYTCSGATLTYSCKLAGFSLSTVQV